MIYRNSSLFIFKGQLIGILNEREINLSMPAITLVTDRIDLFKNNIVIGVKG